MSRLWGARSRGLVVAALAMFLACEVPPTEPGAEPAAMSALTPTTGTGTAGVAIPGAQLPAVRVVDASGSGASGVSVTFTVGGGGTITGGSATTSSSGDAALTGWVLAQTAGANTVTATVSGLPPVVFTFTGVAGAATRLAFVSTPPTAASNRVALPSFGIRLADQFGNATTGSATITASVSSGSLTGGSATTDATGVATFSSLTYSGLAGSRTLTFSATNLTPVGTTIAVTAGAAASIAIANGNNQTAAAGSSLTVKPQVRVSDADGNGVSNVPVTFTVTSGGGSATGTSQTTDASGFAQVSDWVLGPTAGTNTLMASISSPSASVTFTATATGGSASVLAVSTAPSGARSRLPFTVQPTVQLSDASGNPVPTAGVVVTAALTNGGGSIGGVTTATTNSSGLATFANLSLTGTTGTKTLTFSAPGLTSTTSNVILGAGLATKVQALAGNAQTAVVATQVATAPSVKVTDADGNGVPGIAVEFTVSSGGGIVTGNKLLTNDAGVAAAQSWSIGTSTLSAHRLLATVVDTTSGGIRFDAGTNSTIGAASVTGSPVVFEVTAQPGPAVGLGFFIFPTFSPRNRLPFPTQPWIRVQDAFGNLVAMAGVVVTATISSGGGTLVGTATATTESDGIAKFTNLAIAGTVGARTLTFTASGSAAGLGSVSVNRTLTPGLPVLAVAHAGQAQSAVVGTSVTPVPTVKVTDQDGNGVSGVGVTFAATAGGGDVSSPSVLTDASGLASPLSWTLGINPASPNMLSATVVDTTSGSLRFEGGTNSTFTVPAIQGTPVIFTATALDRPACSNATAHAIGDFNNGTLDPATDCLRNVTGAWAPMDRYQITVGAQTAFATNLQSAVAPRQIVRLWGSNNFFLYSNSSVANYVFAPGTWIIEATTPDLQSSPSNYTFTTVANASSFGCFHGAVTAGVTINHDLDTGCNFTTNAGNSVASKAYYLAIPPGGASKTLSMTSSAFAPMIEVYRVIGITRTFVAVSTELGSPASITLTPGNLYEIRATHIGNGPLSGPFTLTIP